jgi:hypothetical protein
MLNQPAASACEPASPAYAAAISAVSSPKRSVGSSAMNAIAAHSSR